MRINNFLFVLIIFLIYTSSCLPKKLNIDNESLKLVIPKCQIIDTNMVELILKLTNTLSKESIVIIVDPWIRESWNFDGSLLSVFVDTSSLYPFIQLLNIPKHGQADVYRSYPFSAFKQFVSIPPKSDILCKVQFQINENFLKDINFALPILVEIPFADVKTFTNYRMKDQVISENKELVINLVDPEYYPYSTTEKYKNKMKLEEVFKFQTGFSGNILILKK